MLLPHLPHPCSPLCLSLSASLCSCEVVYVSVYVSLSTMSPSPFVLRWVPSLWRHLLCFLLLLFFTPSSCTSARKDLVQSAPPSQNNSTHGGHDGGSENGTSDWDPSLTLTPDLNTTKPSLTLTLDLNTTKPSPTLTPDLNTSLELQPSFNHSSVPLNLSPPSQPPLIPDPQRSPATVSKSEMDRLKVTTTAASKIIGPSPIAPMQPGPGTTPHGTVTSATAGAPSPPATTTPVPVHTSATEGPPLSTMKPAAPIFTTSSPREHTTRLSTTGTTASSNEPVSPGTGVPVVEVAGGAVTRQLVDTASLLAVLLFGLLFFLVTVAVFTTQAYESYKRKDYTQVDYLINGMYTDSGV